MQNLLIKSGQANYEINFCNDIESLVSELNEFENAIILIDKQLYSLYPKLVNNYPYLIVEATEENKSFENIKPVLDFLQKHRANKATTVVAIGGGIIQDIAAFTTHIYFRGISWVFVPTTLLAMCDSCIGAKCGINVNEYKNQVGVFHAPSKILISDIFLNTLSDAHIQSGYGEVLKHFLSESKELFLALKVIFEKQGLRNSQILEDIYESLKFKQKVVEADEYESDYRRILNYGHSFGHALEPLSDFHIPHGTAIAWGMDLVNYISFKDGLLSEENFLEIHDFIKKYFSFDYSLTLTADTLIDYVKTDKKVKNGKISLALLKDFGEMLMIEYEFDDTLKNKVDEYLKLYNYIKNEDKTLEKNISSC